MSATQAQEEEQSRTSSFGGLVSDAVSNTGMQGLPNVQRAKNWCRKISWLLICVTGVGQYVVQVSGL